MPKGARRASQSPATGGGRSSKVETAALEPWHAFVQIQANGDFRGYTDMIDAEIAVAAAKCWDGLVAVDFAFRTVARSGVRSER